MSSFDYRLYENALLFALKAHDGQLRKYVGGPYVAHPIRVAGMMMQLPDNFTEKNAMVAAALLHDVVEDCDVSHQQICDEFGGDIAELVHWMTKDSKPSDGNRQVRKEIDRLKLSKAPNPARLIKCADLIDNTESIAVYDPNFSKVYLPEKWRLLHVIEPDYDPTHLWQTAMFQTQRAADKLGITLPDLQSK